MKAILADNNIRGHMAVLLRFLRGPDLAEFWDSLHLPFTTFHELGLTEEASDAVLWQVCQREHIVLVTANRNAADPDSLEATIRGQNAPDCLPVFTIANSNRVLQDRDYAERVAVKLLDYLLSIENFKGTGRLYLSDQLAQRMLMRAVGHADSATASPLDTLTDRELEVFAMIGQGQATRQIAEKLDLSVKTIESYRENIKTKLDLKNAAELSLHAVHWTMENH